MVLYILWLPELLYSKSWCIFCKSECNALIKYMIDIHTYRLRIGSFSPTKKSKAQKTALDHNKVSLENSQTSITECLGYILYMFFTIYCTTISMIMVICLTAGLGYSNYDFDYIRPLSYALNQPTSAIISTKFFYLILISFALRKIITSPWSTYYWGLPSILFNRVHSVPDKVIADKSDKNIAVNCSYITQIYAYSTHCFYKLSSFLHHAALALAYWMFLLNFLMIAIINPGLLNPGPENTLSVAYQNVQGLIPFGQLHDDNPTLDVSKMIELNLFVNEHKPDILILNETWLKASIADNEILPSTYKIFRLDRSFQTHPPSPTNPSKYRRNGGGVLIAIRSDLDIVSKLVKLKCNAEILGVELQLSDGKKLLICSCYRVGTLGSSNHSHIDNYLKSIKRKRNVNSVYLIGDINLAHVNWDILSSSDPVEQSFVNTFCEVGFEQLVNSATHLKGNILDVLLSTEPHKVENLSILSDLSLSLCKSDHFLIKFDIKYKARRKKPAKRTIYNFKRADWDSLNRDFHNTNWNSLLGSHDVDSAWLNFKSHLNHLANTHIPKIKIKSEFQPPWFDSEVYHLCREKERLRSRYKGTKSEILYMKFSECRRKLVCSKSAHCITPCVL